MDRWSSQSLRDHLMNTYLTPSAGRVPGRLKRAVLAFSVVASAALVGCASGSREEYYESRGTVISASAGDGSLLISQSRVAGVIARANDIE